MQIAPLAASRVNEQLDLGNFSFKVIAAEPWRNRKTFFFVSTPFPLRKNRLRDRISSALLSVGGEPTKRGLRLFYSLLEIEGVEPSLDDLNRQLLVAVIDDQIIDGESWSSHVLRGMPRDVAFAIQATCMGL